MLPEVAEEPDPAGPRRYVGQDRAGHLPLRDSRKRVDGRFVSHGAAMSCARAEQQMCRACGENAFALLVQLSSSAPIAKHERALQRAA